MTGRTPPSQRGAQLSLTFKVFCDEFTREMNRLRIEASSTLDAARAEIKRIDRDLGKLLQAIKSGGSIESIVVDMKRLEARKKNLERSLAEAI